MKAQKAFIPDRKLVNSFTLPAVSATSSEASVHTGRIVGVNITADAALLDLANPTPSPTKKK